MKKILSILILSVVVIGALQFVPAVADTEAQLLAKITGLEKKVADQHEIIMAQIHVILDFSDNYKKVYEPFSLEKFPTTGGFDPEWLQGERTEILDTCKNFNNAGLNPNYCKFIQ